MVDMAPRLVETVPDLSRSVRSANYGLPQSSGVHYGIASQAGYMRPATFGASSVNLLPSIARTTDYLPPHVPLSEYPKPQPITPGKPLFHERGLVPTWSASPLRSRERVRPPTPQVYSDTKVNFAGPLTTVTGPDYSGTGIPDILEQRGCAQPLTTVTGPDLDGNGVPDILEGRLGFPASRLAAWREREPRPRSWSPSLTGRAADLGFRGRNFADLGSDSVLSLGRPNFSGALSPPYSRDLDASAVPYPVGGYDSKGRPQQLIVNGSAHHIPSNPYNRDLSMRW